jgi:hypothetical protein
MNLLLSIMGITSLLPKRSMSQKDKAFCSGCFSPLFNIAQYQEILTENRKKNHQKAVNGASARAKRLKNA